MSANYNVNFLSEKYLKYMLYWRHADLRKDKFLHLFLITDRNNEFDDIANIDNK